MNPSVLFDFDGTLADTMEVLIEIYNSVIAPEFHCRPILAEQREWIRTKRPQALMADFNAPLWKLPWMVLRARKELKLRVNEIRLFPGVAEAIAELKNAGYRLGISTSNSHENVGLVLKKTGLADAFEFAYSAKYPFGKSKLIRLAARRFGISTKDLIYAGDETRDIEAARKAGAGVISVSWGFNTRIALEQMKPDALADRPEELPGLISDWFRLKNTKE